MFFMAASQEIHPKKTAGRPFLFERLFKVLYIHVMQSAGLHKQRKPAACLRSRRRLICSFHAPCLRQDYSVGCQGLSLRGAERWSNPPRHRKAV